MSARTWPDSVSTVGVFSVSAPPLPEDLQHGLAMLRAAGLQVRDGIGGCQPCRYMAGNDEERARRLQQLLQDPDIDLLLAARGGFGASRILPLLDWELLRSRNLPVVGHSDVTALHLAAWQAGCRRQLCGPMLCKQWLPAAAATLPQTLQSLCDCLNQNENLLPDWHGSVTLQPGQASGPLVPVNLTILCSLIGTPFLPDLQNAILVLEDIAEPAYRIDRCLCQLSQAGILNRLGALVFGQFSQCEDARLLPEIFSEYARRLPIPVLTSLAFGHVNPSLTLPTGAVTDLLAEPDHVSLRLNPRERYDTGLFTYAGQRMPYRLLRPANPQPEKRYPLILFLHGAGERGLNNQLQLVHGAPAFADDDARHRFPAFVLFPQCPQAEKWVDSPWNNPVHLRPDAPSRNLECALKLLDHILDTCPVDRDRLYIMGISMGGFGTWDAIARHPRRFAAAVPICGGGDCRDASSLAHLPIWIFHGDSDTAVPVTLSRQMHQTLTAAGAPVRYTEYPGVAHNAWTPAMQTPELLPWLFAQRRRQD